MMQTGRMGPSTNGSTTGEKRRYEIAKTAMQLFKRQGFHKTSVREIAEAMGVNQATLYLYVRSKDEMLYLSCAQMMEAFEPAVPADYLPEEIDIHLANEFIDRLIGVDAYRSEMKVVYRETASLPPEMQQKVMATQLRVRDSFISLLNFGIDNGRIRSCHVEVIAENIIMFAHMWAIKGWALWRSVSLREYAIDQVRCMLAIIPFDPPLDAKRVAYVVERATARV